ncbi:MAG TPA: hypothetical protein VGO06_13715 [Bosea sp. (in: a-proteobacteria)]|uniref:hypothetical protein n=1 Tax=Bosea sp. (in: a-proteobacteria) TaxID=1871050 RepID=UPI002E14D016|nr:hypothetical protein [Bosea sp. (in: a-proteobacteria)]
MLTVVTPAADRKLLTEAEMRAAAGLPADDASQDPALAALNDEVSAILTTACRVARAGVIAPTLRQETLSETFRSTCDGEMWLSRHPVASVTSIHRDSDLVAPEGYAFDAATGRIDRILSSPTLSWRPGSYVVVYTAGWADVPVELKLAAKKLVAALRSETARDPSLKRVEIPGVITREWWVGPKDDPLIPGEVMSLISPFVNHAREP